MIREEGLLQLAECQRAITAQQQEGQEALDALASEADRLAADVDAKLTQNGDANVLRFSRAISGHVDDCMRRIPAIQAVSGEGLI